MSLASTQADIDAAVASLIADINAAQATYLAANGVYWQGLVSHTVIPADGGSVAADNLTSSPTDQEDTWEDFLGEDAPGSLPAAIYVHTYQKPSGVKGYRIQKLFIYEDEFYSSTVDSGNAPEEEVEWDTDPDTNPPVLPAPTISDIDPAEGDEAGGTEVDITGTGFQVGVSVTFDGEAATSIVRNSATSITCDTPAGEGTVDVVVTNIDSKSATATNGYEYTASGTPPSIVQYKTGTGSGSGDLTITLDNSTTSGNCIMLILRSNSGGSWGGLGSWTEIPDTGVSGCRMYYRISAGGAMSVTFDDDGSAKADEKCGIMFEITGNNATPIDASYSASPTGTSPDRTSTVDNCLVIRGGGSSTGSTDFETAPSSHTLLARAKRELGDNVVAIAYATAATAGAVGSAAWDAGSYANAIAFTVVVKP